MTDAKKTAKKAPAKKAPAKKAPASKAPAEASNQSAASIANRAAALMASMEADDAAREQRRVESERRRSASVKPIEGVQTRRGMRYRNDNWVGVVVASFLLLGSLNAIVQGHDNGTQAAGVVTAVIGVLLAYRTVTTAVFVNVDGIVVRNTFRARQARWEDIAGYKVMLVNSARGRKIRTLGLLLKDGSQIAMGAFRCAGNDRQVTDAMRQATLTIEQQRQRHLAEAGPSLQLGSGLPEPAPSLPLLWP